MVTEGHKEWGLTSDEMCDVGSAVVQRCKEQRDTDVYEAELISAIAEAQAKKLLKYLDKRGLLVHGYPFHDYNCEACKLLKGVGL